MTTTTATTTSNARVEREDWSRAQDDVLDVLAEEARAAKERIHPAHAEAAAALVALAAGKPAKLQTAESMEKAKAKAVAKADAISAAQGRDLSDGERQTIRAHEAVRLNQRNDQRTVRNLATDVTLYRLIGEGRI